MAGGDAKGNTVELPNKVRFTAVDFGITMIIEVIMDEQKQLLVECPVPFRYERLVYHQSFD